MKIKGLDSREIISLPERNKCDEHGMTFLSPHIMKVYNS